MELYELDPNYQLGLQDEAGTGRERGGNGAGTSWMKWERSRVDPFPPCSRPAPARSGQERSGNGVGTGREQAG